MMELELLWTKIQEMTTDGAPSMIEKKTGLRGRIRREKDRQNPEFYVELRCIIHQHSLCGKNFEV
jgi:hypothetical protein